MAASKVITVVTNVKEFKKVLDVISKSSDFLAQQIHIAGMFALEMVNVHNDSTNAQQLIEALGRKHDKKRVQQWLIHFGKLAVNKDKVMVFRKRKDISPENLAAWMLKANDTPYWELNKQTEVKYSFDYLNLVKSVIAIHEKKVADLVADGKQVSEMNVGVLAELHKIVNSFTPAVVNK